MIWPRIWRTSIKSRLMFLFFAITAGAIMVIYFYVVPQLESSLVSQKVDSLRRDSLTYSRLLQGAIGREVTASQLDAIHPRDQRGDRHAGDAQGHPGRRRASPRVGQLGALRDLGLAGRQDPAQPVGRPRAARRALGQGSDGDPRRPTGATSPRRRGRSSTREAVLGGGVLGAAQRRPRHGRADHSARS